MESSSLLSPPWPSNNQLSNQINGRSYSAETGQDQDSLQGTHVLIANLDHELWDVRLRALKCIVSKLDSGIVSAENLSRRVDLLVRLSDWLREATSDVTSRKSNSSSSGGGSASPFSINVASAAGKGIPIVIQLLIRLVEFEDTRQFILKEKVDSLLAEIRLQVNGETRTLLEKLLYRVHTSSFDFLCEGPPELWDDNTSNHPVVADQNSSRESNIVEKYQQHFDQIMERGEGEPGINEPEVIQLDTSGSSVAAGDYYFSKQSIHSPVDKSWAAGVKFGIPDVQLSGTDRRVLASTVESLLSRNESLVFMTSCFVRDVLLQDYPPEVFIQESALSMGFLEVAETTWQDSKVNYVAVQGLLKLSNMLRFRISQLNSSEFYQIKLSPQEKPMPSFYDGSGSSFGYQYNRNISSFTSDMFVGNLTQLMKSLSRTLIYQPEDFHLWSLMDSFSFTLYKFTATFPVDSKSLSLGLQEVLMDLAHCYEKNIKAISSPDLVLTLSSILRTLHINGETIIGASDVRRCLRNLICSPELFHCWPEVYQYFLQYVSPFDQTLTPVEKAFHESKMSNPEYQPRELIVKLLYAVQNATGHEAVSDSLNQMWRFLLPLVINTRHGGNLLDYIFKDAPWRDSFFRFLCVEPTCTEDEELLLKVVDVLAFLISNMNEGVKTLTDWIVPLCMEKGCAGLRLLSEHSLKMDTPYAGTMLPTLLRSLFDFYTVILNKTLVAVEDEFLWDVFSTFCVILHELGENGFVFSAVLQPVLHGVALLTSKSAIQVRLTKNSKFCLALIFRVQEAIISLQDRGAGVSSESYRNQGALYYASLSLLHLSLILANDKKPPLGPDWIGKCCAVIPCLWESRDVRVRALGFQLCQVITASSKGAVMSMTIMESPSVVWTNAYGALMDAEESSVVKHKAACVLLNLLVTWKDVESSEQLNKPLQLPNWATVEDFTKLLFQVYWLPSMAEVFRSGDSSTAGDEEDVSSNVQLVTPKVLAVVCKILMAMNVSTIPQFHSNSFVQAVCSSGICPLLFRLLGGHSVSINLEPSWWLDCCHALSCIVESLICMIQLDRSICVSLIGDKRSVGSLAQLFLLEVLPGKYSEKAFEILSTLWVNVFTLLSTLIAESGNNFEDLERVIWIQWNVIFGRLVDWLKQGSLVKCRKVALTFTHGLLSRLTLKQQDKENSSNGSSLNLNQSMEVSHHVLCREWKTKKASYGSVLCQSLMEVYDDAISPEEKQSVLNTITALICLSPSAKSYAIEQDLVGVLIEKLRNFALKYYDSSESPQLGKKSVNHDHEETLCILSVLSALVYKSMEAKKSALFNCMGDVFHKIFKCWKSYQDRTMLHTFIETLMNFTEEFPAGSQALTVTTNVLGVGPRKVPTPHSFLIEIIGILQNELDVIDKNPNIKTIEYIFELLKNAVFVMECRNAVVKSSIPSFLQKLHVREIKKWGTKQHHIKILYLEFLVHLTPHPDMQSVIAKVPESIEILILLIDLEDHPTSLLALKILRNLSFQAGNRARFFCDDGLMPALSAKIRDSESLEEVENAAVGLWALISNSEKGKLLAKKSFCHTSVSKAVARFRKRQQSSNDLLTEKQDLSNLINVLTTLGELI